MQRGIEKPVWPKGQTGDLKAMPFNYQGSKVARNRNLRRHKLDQD